MSFTTRVQNSLGEMVYLVKGEDGGKPAWHYVLIDKVKLPLFREAIKAGNLDLNEYGKILHSGWGENPPQDITDQMKKQYS